MLIIFISSLKSKKANAEQSIEQILEICIHPDWRTKITQLFSMHNGRKTALNEQFFETLKEGSKAEFQIVDAFLRTGSQASSYAEIKLSKIQKPSHFIILKFCPDLSNRSGNALMI